MLVEFIKNFPSNTLKLKLVEVLCEGSNLPAFLRH
jgi:hypothetical protein